MRQPSTVFENIVEKGAIYPFPTMFSTQSDNCIPIFQYFMTSSFAAELEEPKIGISGKGLKSSLKLRI